MSQFEISAPILDELMMVEELEQKIVPSGMMALDQP